MGIGRRSDRRSTVDGIEGERRKRREGNKRLKVEGKNIECMLERRRSERNGYRGWKGKGTQRKR